MRSAELEEIISLLSGQREELYGRVRGVAQSRERLDGLAQVFPLPDDVDSDYVDADGVPARLLTPPGASDESTLLYLHGGGYGGGSSRSHAELAARIGRAVSSPVLLPDYRLAPEHPFPAALEDALATYRWLLARHGGDGSRIAVAGDSAGGGLSVAMCASLRDGGETLPRAVALLSPWVDLTCTSPSWDSRFEGDVVLDHNLRDAAKRYLGGVDARDPLASPLFADLTGLPPLLIQVGTHEILYDDAVSLAEQATRAGVEAELEIGEELIHVWQIFPITPEAMNATARIARHLAPLT